jgi:hypothetical protein
VVTKEKVRNIYFGNGLGSRALATFFRSSGPDES